MSIPKYHFRNIFAATCAWRKYRDLCALGAHTPVNRVHWWWGISRGSLLPLDCNQISLAVLNLTPGPMVEAATQLLIY